MAAAPDIRIPRQHEQLMINVSKLEPAAFDRLAQALEAVPEGATSTVFQLALEQADLPDISASDLVDALLGINVLRSSHGWDVSGTSDGLADAAEDLNAGINLPAYKQRMRRLLNVDSLWHTAKAYDVATAYKSSVHTLRILTDVRPIFDEDAGTPPRSVVIMHNLEIRTYDESGRQSTEYFALDKSDLISLKNAAERAMKKSDTLAPLLGRADLAVHDLGTE